MVVGARMMNGYIGMERDCGEDVDIYVGIGEFLFQGWFLVDTCTCWRVSCGKILAFACT